MKYLSALFGTTLFGLMLAACGPVRADYLNWTYTSSPNVPGISVNAGSNGGATVTLTDFSTPQPGGTSIPVIAYITDTASTTPIRFSNETFQLALKITDGNGDSGTLNFTGFLNGSITAPLSPSSVGTSSLVASFAPKSESLTFDGHTYTVTIPSMTLAPPGSTQQNIMASVTVTNALNNPNPPPNGGGSGGKSSGTPEPASLLLGSLGFSCFGVGCWWKRRQLTRSVAAA
jgi:hypothetical protein